jgi:small GTP-binding protein
MKEKAIERNNEIATAMQIIIQIIDEYSTFDTSTKDSLFMRKHEAKLLLEQIEHKTFTVSVVATVKAGKSTFLNALLGDEYLPTSNVPETSSVLYIKHNKENTYLQKNSEKIFGQKQILDEIKSRNKLFREAGIDTIEKYTLYIPYSKLENIEGVNFQFVDTPGPNEAGNIQIKKQVEKILNIADVIVYLLDYTKLNTNDENNLFDEMKTIRSDLFLNAKDRLFFVINKIDSINTNSLPLDETIEFIKNGLKRLFEKDYEFKIFGVKAELALLARMIKNSNFDRIDDLGKKAYGFGWQEDYDIEKKNELLKDYLDKTIQDSGLLTLEDKIIDYIVNNSESLFFKSIVDKSIRIIDETENLLKLKRELSKKSDKEIKEMAERLRSKVNSIEKELEKIDNIVNNFSKEVQNEIKTTFDDFEKHISKLIDSILNYKKNNDKDEKSKLSKCLENFADSGSDVAFDFLSPGKTQTEKNRNKKIGKDIYKLCKASLKLIMNTANIFTNSVRPDEAREKINELNKAISNIVITEFGTIREDLEIVISNKNNQINNELEIIIKKANRDFFGYLNNEFGSDLFKEANIELPTVDSLQISNDYDSFLNKKYEKEGCRWDFWNRRDILVEVSIKQYELISWWKRNILKEKNVSLKTVIDYIDSSIFFRIKNIKNVFNDIARDYILMIDSQCYNINDEAQKNKQNEQLLDESIEKLELLEKKITEENI